MPNITVTIRNLDRDLLRSAKASAARKGIRLSKWLNDAISLKLFEDATFVHDIDDIIEETDIDGVFMVPRGTIKVGEDYSFRGCKLCAAGTKNGVEVVTYQSPSILHENGFSIFWVR